MKIKLISKLGTSIKCTKIETPIKVSIAYYFGLENIFLAVTEMCNKNSDSHGVG